MKQKTTTKDVVYVSLLSGSTRDKETWDKLKDTEEIHYTSV